MSNIAVIYQSKYGFTETYARWIAEELHADLLTGKEAKSADLQRYTSLLFGGGLYAGGVSGISLLTRNVDSLRGKNLGLFTVGVSDVADPENVAFIRKGLEQALPAPLREQVRLYHFRGGICYSKMTFLHRAMMGMMRKMLQKKPESELRLEDRELLKSFGQDADFTNRGSIAPLVADFTHDPRS